MTRSADLIAVFETAAQDARGAEDAYRRKAARRIDELALERTAAFRRLNLIRVIAAAIARKKTPETAVKAARAAVKSELEWSSETKRQKEVLDRLDPVFASLAAGEAQEGAEHPAVAELRAFEAWYRVETGSDFYALFDSYMPVTPVVDF